MARRVQPFRRILIARGKPRSQFLACLIVLSIISATLTAGDVPPTEAATLGSWNQHVQCTPSIVRITDITANQTGSKSLATSKFNPGITTTVPNGLAKRWLTPGPTPTGWVSPGPQCSVTNSRGTTSLYVEIDGVERGSPTTEDPATAYDPTNGGASHTKTYDTTFNIFDPRIVPNYDTSCTSPTDPTCYGRIHLEIDHDWMAAAYCGKNTTCDPDVLASQTSRNSTRIDVQGFVYWDPNNLNSTFHSYSGWELHPLTGWRLSALPSPDFTVSTNPSSLTLNPGYRTNLTTTVTSQNGFTGTVNLSTSTSTGLNVTCNPTSITGGSGTSTCTLTSSAPGTYTVTITGTSGSLSHSTIVTVQAYSSRYGGGGGHNLQM